eukprot:TRINITY_DN6324_c0_g1_i1.p1 TRINITY_DN6324_c0_g1~~TRINITY_DN6324_c0_g1_i1.p1  ORF type:complete len:1095 (+),score=240.25 TRINITY_DN6324_c0_g1_i1:29-3286(+)
MDTESMDVDGPDQELAGASGGDLFYRVARDLAQTSAWQRDLPRHERHVIEAALKSERVWKSLFSSSHEDDGTDSTASKSQPSTNSTKRKRGAAAVTPKKTKLPASKKKSDKKGTSTSEDGEDVETTHLDVLNSRVRCMVFDAVVDELFPPERYTSDPWADAVRLENAPTTIPESLPYWTLEDMTDINGKLDGEDSADEDSIPEITLEGLKSLPSTDGGPPPRKRAKLSPVIVTPLGATRPARVFDKLELVSVHNDFKALLSALDYVVQACREYTPHSDPFLVPVSRLEAPTYYDVIKKPMDFSTLATKLSDLKYFSKLEFATELELIFTNCRLFNDPTSIYVQHADELEKFAIALMNKVPDYDYSHERARVTQELAALDSPSAIEKARAAVLAASTSSLAASEQHKEIKRSQFYKEDPVLAKLRQVRNQVLSQSGENHSDSAVPQVRVEDLPSFLVHPASVWGKLEAPEVGDFSLPTPLRRIVQRNKQFLAKIRNKEPSFAVPAPVDHHSDTSTTSSSAAVTTTSAAATSVKEEPTQSASSSATTPSVPIKTESSSSDAMQVDTPAAPVVEQKPALLGDTATTAPVPSTAAAAAAAVLNDDTELQMDDELANEILRQCVAVQSALHGFDHIQELALDVLTSATEIFTERIGFLIRSFIDVPGSKTDLVEVLQNSFSELLPHGILTLRDYVVQDTYKFNNRLQNLPQSEVDKWLKLSGRSASDSVQVTVGSLHRDYFLQTNPFVKKNPEASKMLQQLPTLGIIHAPAHVSNGSSTSSGPSSSTGGGQQPPNAPNQHVPVPSQSLQQQNSGPNYVGQAPQPPQNQIPVQPPMQQYVSVGQPPRPQPPHHMAPGAPGEMHQMHPDAHAAANAAGRPPKKPVVAPPHTVVPVMQQPTQPAPQPMMPTGVMPPDMNQPRPQQRGPGRPPRNPPAAPVPQPFQGPPQIQQAPMQHQPHAHNPMGGHVGSGPQLVHHGAPLGSHALPAAAPPPHVPPQTIPLRPAPPMMQIQHDDHSGEYHPPRTPQTPQTPGSVGEGESDDGRQRRSRQRQNYGDYLMEDDTLSDDFEETEDGKKKKSRKSAGRGTPARKK